MRKRLALLGAGLCLSGSLVSAGAPAAVAQSNGKVVTLTYWAGFTGGDMPTYVRLVNLFNSTHPDIKVDMTIEPWDTLYQKLPTAMGSGDVPDIATPDYNVGTLREYIKQGLVQPINSLLGNGANQVPASVIPSAIKSAFTVNGQLYAAPANWATLELYWNKTLFAKAGISGPPKTMTELEQDAVKLTVKSGSTVKQYGMSIADHATIAMWPIFIWANGGNLLNSAGCSDLTNPKTVQAVSTWATLISKDDITQVGLSGQDADNLFSAQKSAMEINGPWATGEYLPVHVNFGLAQVPIGAIGKPVTTASSVPMVLNAKSKNEPAALTFFSWWLSKPAQAILAEGVGYPPSRTDMANYPGLNKNPYVAGFSAQSPYAEFYLPTLANFSYVDTSIFSPAIQEAERGVDAATALKAASEELNSAVGCK
jgi:multiple sugar transport system substrate-binding protein